MPDRAAAALELAAASPTMGGSADHDADGCTAMGCQACPTCAGAMLAQLDRVGLPSVRRSRISDTGDRQLAGRALAPEPLPPRS